MFFHDEEMSHVSTFISSRRLLFNVILASCCGFSEVSKHKRRTVGTYIRMTEYIVILINRNLGNKLDGS